RRLCRRPHVRQRLGLGEERSSRRRLRADYAWPPLSADLARDHPRREPTTRRSDHPADPASHSRRRLLAPADDARPAVRRAAAPLNYRARAYTPCRGTASRPYRQCAPLRTAEILPSVCLASPNTIIVCGRTNSSFSIPAKPGFIDRLSTMIALA